MPVFKIWAASLALKELPTEQRALRSSPRTSKSPRHLSKIQRKAFSAPQKRLSVCGTSIERQTKEMTEQSKLTIKTAEKNEYRLVYGLNVAMLIYWNCRYSNTLSDSSLVVELLTSIHRMFNWMNDEPGKLQTSRFDFALPGVVKSIDILSDGPNSESSADKSCSTIAQGLSRYSRKAQTRLVGQPDICDSPISDSMRVFRLTHTSTFNAAINASCGISTLPNWRMRFLPSFCLSRSLRFLVTSPP